MKRQQEYLHSSTYLLYSHPQVTLQCISYLSVYCMQMQVILGHRLKLEVRQPKSHLSGPKLA